MSPGRLARLGRHPFKVEIIGSNPIRGTNFRHEKDPRYASRVFSFGVCCHFAAKRLLRSHWHRGCHRRVELRGRSFLNTREAMRVEIQGDCDRRVPQPFRDRFWGDTLL